MLTRAPFDVFMLCDFEYINVLWSSRDLVACMQGEK